MRKAKAPRRRRAPIGPTSKSTRTLQLKSYRFKFNPTSQILVSTATSGQMVLSTTAGGAPIKPTSFTLVTPSSSGLPGFWDIAMAVPFQLADLNYVANFQSMFDAYKFGKVGVQIEYLNNTSNVNSTGLMPSIYMYWDQDDAAVPASLASISGKQGVKIRQFGDRARTSVRTSFTPTTVMGISTQAGIALAGVNNKPQWINCTQPAVNHFGLKMYITDVYLPGSSAVNQAFRFNFTYNIAFRAPLLTA